MLEFYKHVTIDIGDVKEYKNNARQHSEAQIDQLVFLIKEHGFTNPLLIDEKNRLIAGHGRMRAAIQLGYDALPAIVVTGLTRKQFKALVIADNKSALSAHWDTDMLQAELKSLGDVALAGFSDEEFQALTIDKEFPLNDSVGGARQPRKTDDGFAAFEVIIKHDDKIHLVDCMNKLKDKNGLETNADVLMLMVEYTEKFAFDAEA
jgi:ParB-like chromosome segregation protein Spo0J